MQKQAQKTVFRVIDALNGPHKGRVIRLRLKSGQAPAIRDLKGAVLAARSPGGDEEEMLQVVGFFAPGGKPSDSRLQRTGRVDLLVAKKDGDGLPAVSLRWTVTGPQSA